MSRFNVYAHTGVSSKCTTGVCVLLLIFAIFGGARADDSLSNVVATALEQSPILALSHSGRWLVFKGQDGFVTVVDTLSGTRSRLRAGHNEVQSACWSHDDTHLVIASRSSFSVYVFPQGRLLGETNDVGAISQVDISPDGQYVSAVKDHTLWLARLPKMGLAPLIDGANPSLLEGETDAILATEFNLDRHYWWSPDSSAIAYIETEFLADRYPLPGAKLPLFRLKTIDPESRLIRTISASDDQWPYLLRVTWHPDGHRIFFYRLNRPQTAAELAVFDGTKLSTLLTEQDAYWINPPARPQFTMSDGIVVTSERSGANHIYLYRMGGEELRDLTPAGFEVYDLHPSPEARDQIYVTAGSGDKQDEQFYRIDSRSGAWKKLSSGAGRHQVMLDDAGDSFVDSHSTASSTAEISWHGVRRTHRQFVAMPAADRPATFTEEFRPFLLHDGTALPARLFKPNGFDAKRKYPMLVYVAPGPRGRVAANSWGGWQMAWNRYMVGQGYLVLAVDPRGSGGYGHLFEEYIHYRPGAQEIVDVREVVDTLKREPFIDPQRIGVWGSDYGAYVVVRSMLDTRDTFKAGIAASPIVDMGKYDAYFVERYLGLPSQHGFEYYDAMAAKNARRITGSLMLVSSSADPLIDSSHLEALRKAIDQAKKKHPEIDQRYRTWSSGDADYRKDPKQLAALFSAMKTFFDERL